MKYLLFVITTALLIAAYIQYDKFNRLLNSGRIPDIEKAKAKSVFYILLALITVVVFLLSGCKKDDWVAHPDKVGRHFNLKTIDKDYYNFVMKPTNPFKIDSIKIGAFFPFDGYWCSSANGYHNLMFSGESINDLIY